jgi:hypothetical protein
LANSSFRHVVIWMRGLLGKSEISPQNCCAYTIHQLYVEIDPYPECKSEYQVVSNIIDGLPPYSVAQLSNMGPLGGYHIMPDAPWITNGILAAMLRCWNQDGYQRPTAVTCLKDLVAISETIGSKLSSVSPDVRNLTGKVATPDHPRKRILGHCRGTWRYD